MPSFDAPPARGTTVEALCTTLAAIAPLRLAESWDNVGLLVGDRRRLVQRVMTCLTLTANVVDEAISQSADLVVTHHPLPFRPLERLTTDSVTGSLLIQLIRGDVAVYSAHTAYDSAADGINQAWSGQLNLHRVRPLLDPATDSSAAGHAPDTVGNAPGAESASRPAATAVEAIVGSGRFGDLPEPMRLADVVLTAARSVGAASPRLVGSAERLVSRIAIACGSGGSFVAAAKRRGCDLLLTGEATFHQCLEAEALAVGLGLLGHYESERFGIERLSASLSELHPELQVWPSRHERSPLTLLTL